MQPSARTRVERRSHTSGLRSVFSEAHVLGKNGLDCFFALRREKLCEAKLDLMRSKISRLTYLRGEKTDGHSIECPSVFAYSRIMSVYDVGAGLVPARLGRSHVRENGRPQGSELRHERRFHTRRGRRPAHGRARRFRTRVRPCRRGGACPRPFRSVSCPGNGRPQGSPLRHERRFPP